MKGNWIGLINDTRHGKSFRRLTAGRNEKGIRLSLSVFHLRHLRVEAFDRKSYYHKGHKCMG